MCFHSTEWYTFSCLNQRSFALPFAIILYSKNLFFFSWMTFMTFFKYSADAYNHFPHFFFTYKTSNKILLIVYAFCLKSNGSFPFFDVNGIIQKELLPQGQAVNQQVYKEEGTRLVAGQIIAASTRQWDCTQRPEQPAVPDHGEHRRMGTTSLFSWSCTFFSNFLKHFPKHKGIIKWVRFEGVVAVKWDVMTELMGSSKKNSCRST